MRRWLSRLLHRWGDWLWVEPKHEPLEAFYTREGRIYRIREGTISDVTDQGWENTVIAKARARP